MITTKNQAIQFLTTMQYLYPLLHPEFPADELINEDNQPAFTNEQCEYIENRFDECYELLDDPCAIILGEIRPTMTMFNSKLN